MGKKDKEKKKGKGAAKTAEKTEKKQKTKTKKELAAKGEVEIEAMIKEIEEEEKKRQEVKEIQVPPPSHRSSFSMTAHPDNPELIFFGGEFFNGRKTTMFNDLFIYNIKRAEWSQIKSPGGPPPRSSHQAVLVSQGGGQLWIFGGEFTSPTESQFYHYKDLWCFHFASRRWEKVAASGGPSARSGHRMVVIKKQILVFGGFHDNLRDCKYFNDVHAFDLENRAWKKLETLGSEPSPRSACQMFTTPEGRVVVYGGYSKVKLKRDTEKGVTHTDMFLLFPDKHDPTMSKWRWQAVKQVGLRPSLRTGMACAAGKDRVFMFGGVQDADKEEENEDDDDSEDEDSGNFFNELYTVQVEGERATWHQVQLTGRRDQAAELKKRRRAKKGEGDEEGDEEGEENDEQVVDGLETMAVEQVEGDNKGPTTVTVESGAFTISSTVGQAAEMTKMSAPQQPDPARDLFIPGPRFSAGLAMKSGILYLYGGLWEEGEKDYTLKDFYSLDTSKLDTWATLIESDLQTMEWLGSGSEEEDDDEDDDDEDEDEDGMETD